ncbi:SCP2 sterol-binding domain-containing protein [Larkinella humicola]|uniref:SCP2 sterol-binding domain-containing protein n=1 Tax=Larkinella humicola TaxID=2607654 RepID=A0A5N1JKX1_9BACT|nr:SCP2 sterol-binding domain-containing protein [Larkinella humicola]KAA9353714.1 SCP2 sterol-binding domain-containing protein [Larkinella humicola]
MNLQEFTDQIRQRLGTDSGLDATVKLATDQGVIYIDGRQVPAVVSNEDTDADCTIKVSLSDLQKLGTGDLNPMTAFMFGKLKVQGDMGLAMKIGQKLS